MNEKLITDEAGFSLVEATVAFVLFVAVLVPLSGMFTQLATQRMNKQKIEAIVIAQGAMESAVANEVFVQTSAQREVDNWRVQELHEVEGGLVFIQIYVYRKGKKEPAVVLKTIRLLPVSRISGND